MTRDERYIFFRKMFENPQTRQMNQREMFRKISLSDELFLDFSSKVQNLTFFSIIYMIRNSISSGRENYFRGGFGRHSNEIVNTLSILNSTNPWHGGSWMLRRMRDFAFQVCWMRPFVNSNLFWFSLLVSSIIRSVTVGAVVSVGKDVVGKYCHWSFGNAHWWRTRSRSRVWCYFRH